MSAETFKLAAEAVAAPGWKWLPGMRGSESPVKEGEPVRYARRTAEPGTVDGWHQEAGPNWRMWWREDKHWLPDLDDAATLGCLLSLVREAMGEPRLSTRRGRDLEWPWSVGSGCDDEIGAVRGKTEAAALVAALRGAP